MSVGRAATVGKSAIKQANRFEKYTVEPSGIWSFFHRIFAVDASRSTGIPLNPQFRNPPPGGLDPNTYDDPVTLPAADIAENPYWKRDTRRQYPQLSTVTQGDVVALLSVGSKATPNEQVLQIGEAGKKQLVTVKQEGEEKGVAAFFQRERNLGAAVLGQDGLPPVAPSLNLEKKAVRQYPLLDEQPYDSSYPCRVFG